MRGEAGLLVGGDRASAADEFEQREGAKQLLGGRNVSAFAARATLRTGLLS
jgi:hypothetical protein